MKKIALLIALLMCMNTALAAEWVGGRSPSKPYVGVPEVDLEEKLGYMVLHPNAKMAADSCCEVLRIYLPREDVEAGQSTLFLCSESKGEILRVEFSDSEAVSQRFMTEEELEGLLWGSGTCFEITLPFSLDLDENYFVNMEANCIKSKSGRTGNYTLGGTDGWKFSTARDYGVGGKQYFRPVAGGSPESGIRVPSVGDEVRFTVKVGGDAKMAVLYCNGDSVSFEVTAFTETTEVTGTVMANDVSWGVVFLDEANEILEIVDFTQD